MLGTFTSCERNARRRVVRAALLTALIAPLLVLATRVTPAGAQPALTFLNSGPIQFGMVTVDQCSYQSINYRNTGDEPMQIIAAFVDPSDYDIVSSYPANGQLAVQGTGYTIVKFCPAANGPQNSTLTIIWVGGVASIGLTGTGQGQPAPTSASVTFLNSGPIQFGSVAVGQCSYQSINLRNDGTATLQIFDAGINNSDFQITSGPTTLSPQQTGTFIVKFCPLAAGAQNGTLSLLTNANSPVSSIEVVGTGR